MMKKIVALLYVMTLLYVHKIFSEQDCALYIKEIVNHTDVELFISLPLTMLDTVTVVQNISLTDNQEIKMLAKPENKHFLKIKPYTKAIIDNLFLPIVQASVIVPENFILRPHNYNPFTMQALCVHIPPQNYLLTYTMVHQPLPVIALRQKNNKIETIPGQGVRKIIIDDQSVCQGNRSYQLIINQIKPISYLQHIWHDHHELYDLSEMYLDGGAQVEPLSIDNDTFDIKLVRYQI